MVSFSLIQILVGFQVEMFWRRFYAVLEKKSQRQSQVNLRSSVGKARVNLVSKRKNSRGGLGNYCETKSNHG